MKSPNLTRGDPLARHPFSPAPEQLLRTYWAHGLLVDGGVLAHIDHKCISFSLQCLLTSPYTPADPLKHLSLKAVHTCLAIPISLPEPAQAVTHWQDTLAAQPPEQLLRTYGAHGLFVAGGVLCGKLVRLTFAHEDAAKQASAARLGALLLSAVFCCDAAHPQRAVGFATHAPVEIWPGADLFGGDSYRWVLLVPGLGFFVRFVGLQSHSRIAQVGWGNTLVGFLGAVYKKPNKEPTGAHAVAVV